MLPAISPADHQRRATLLWAIPIPCLPRCRLLPLGDSAARRACAAVLPCASDTPASLADAFAFRARALLVGHVEAGLGRVLVAAGHGRYPTPPMRSFPGRSRRRCLQDATQRSPSHLRRPYSPNIVEEAFCELRLYGVLRSSSPSLTALLACVQTLPTGACMARRGEGMRRVELVLATTALGILLAGGVASL